MNEFRVSGDEWLAVPFEGNWDPSSAVHCSPIYRLLNSIAWIGAKKGNEKRSAKLIVGDLYHLTVFSIVARMCVHAECETFKYIFEPLLIETKQRFEKSLALHNSYFSRFFHLFCRVSSLTVVVAAAGWLVGARNSDFVTVNR